MEAGGASFNNDSVQPDTIRADSRKAHIDTSVQTMDRKSDGDSRRVN